jgi:enhancing lycopene biosynthesis protein 2
MSNQTKFAVVLAGCGVYDGSEIHEATMALYAIMKNGGTYEIFAPDIPQHHVINHLTGEEMNESRNVLIESARIARGKIRAITEFNAGEFDALVFPGGFGVAKNLSGFAFDSENYQVDPEIARVVRDMVKSKKPVGALCISPVLLARIIEKPVLTIGDDPETASAIEKMGAIHKTSGHGDVVVDPDYKFVTSPCYMLDANILQISEGADATIKEILKILSRPVDA